MSVRRRPVSDDDKKIMVDPYQDDAIVDLEESYKFYFYKLKSKPQFIQDIFLNDLEKHLIGEYTNDYGESVKYMKYNLKGYIHRFGLQDFMRDVNEKYQNPSQHRRLSSDCAAGGNCSGQHTHYTPDQIAEIQKTLEEFQKHKLYYAKEIEKENEQHHKKISEIENNAAPFDKCIQLYENTISSNRTGSQFFAHMNYHY
jgi:hypothetical protein